MNTKITKEERNWILYDVGNSAFIMLVTTIIPIYFNYLAGNAGLSDVEYLAYWGYAASFATLVVAILGPICGSIADTKGFKKPIFIISLAVGAGCCIGMGFAKSWLAFLIIFFVAKVGYSGSLIFYDSMLPDITCEDKMDRVSSLGYAYGYIGSCIPFIVCLVIVLGADKLGITMSAAMAISFAITAVWWMAVTIPLIKTYKQKHYVEREKGAIKKSFIRIGQTFKNIKNEKKAFFFLLAFFFYIDGVYTIIDMATAYGSALGLDSTGLLLALLVTQIVAFPCALIYGRLAKKVGAEKLIMVCILAYTGIALFAIILQTQLQFWVLAVLVGMFQGGIQALSRSYFTKIISANQSGEFFGLYDICGKGAAFMGTALVSIVSQLTGSTNAGVGTISIMFIIGLILFVRVVRMEK